MFQFTGFPSVCYGFTYGWHDLSCQVSPFRHLRVMAYLQLTAAFRSLSRLSSALGAKASTLRSFVLDHFWFSGASDSASCLKSICVLSRFSSGRPLWFFSDVFAFLYRNTKHCIRYLIIYELSHQTEALRQKACFQKNVLLADDWATALMSNALRCEWPQLDLQKI